MKQPTIDQYLLSTCLFTIDELNEKYRFMDKEELKGIADEKFNEMDITVRIGYPFKQMVHYTQNDGGERTKVNHDLFIESKDFKIEVKYLKNWACKTGTKSASLTWEPIQKDFDWLMEEIEEGNKGKRAFVIGWFNCVDSFSRYIQIGAGRGRYQIVNEERIAYFPFLRKKKVPTYTTDMLYDYEKAYKEVPLSLVGEKNAECSCLFLGNEKDVFHFAIFF